MVIEKDSKIGNFFSSVSSITGKSPETIFSIRRIVFNSSSIYCESDSNIHSIVLHTPTEAERTYSVDGSALALIIGLLNKNGKFELSFAEDDDENLYVKIDDFTISATPFRGSDEEDETRDLLCSFSNEQLKALSKLRLLTKSNWCTSSPKTTDSVVLFFMNGNSYISAPGNYTQAFGELSDFAVVNNVGVDNCYLHSKVGHCLYSSVLDFFEAMNEGMNVYFCGSTDLLLKAGEAELTVNSKFGTKRFELVTQKSNEASESAAAPLFKELCEFSKNFTVVNGSKDDSVSSKFKDGTRYLCFNDFNLKVPANSTIEGTTAYSFNNEALKYLSSLNFDTVKSINNMFFVEKDKVQYLIESCE